MNDMNWILKTKIVKGGTLSGVAMVDQTIFAVSPSGLFCQDGGEWRPVVEEVPIQGGNGLLCCDGDLLVAGMPSQLIRSSTGGEHWQMGTIEQTDLPILSLAASPNYRQDRVALAGTAGAGVLRSTDGGRYWELNTWGMDELHVFALACAPVWGRRELVVAATESAIYQSPNGGRSWRKAVRYPAVSVQTLLFVDERTVLGGTEEEGLIVSHDGGLNWDGLESDLDRLTVNVLAHVGGGRVMAGTGEGIVALSADNGRTWVKTELCESPILALAAGAETEELLAGTVDDGLYRSQDGGETWSCDEGVAAHRFAWLCHSAKDGKLVAAGPDTDIWLSGDEGITWRALPFAETIHDLVFDGTDIWVASPTGIWSIGPQGANQVKVQPDAQPLWLAMAADTVWVGFQEGDIWQKSGNEETWQTVPTPFQGESLLGLAASPHFADDQTLVAVTAKPRIPDMTVWRSVDGGVSWQSWYTERRLVATPRLALAGLRGEASAISLGSDCLWHTAAGWQKRRLGTLAGPIISLVSLSDGRFMATTAVATHILTLSDEVGDEWQSSDSHFSEPIIASCESG